jgi:hypothetical protein
MGDVRGTDGGLPAQKDRATGERLGAESKPGPQSKPGPKPGPDAGASPEVGKQGGGTGQTTGPKQQGATVPPAFRFRFEPSQIDRQVHADYLPGSEWYISLTGWRFRVTVFYDPPREARPSGETWQVGFIQNVVSDDTILGYESGRPVHPPMHRGQLLDALRPGTQAWLTNQPSVTIHHPGNRTETVRGWGTIVAGASAATLELNMQDFPRDRLCEFRNCGPRGNPLAEYRRGVAFQAWLAARRQTDPESVASSYRWLAATNMWEVRFGVMFEAVDEGRRPRVVDAQNFSIRWADATSSTPRPVVTGQTANQVLGNRLVPFGAARPP